MRRLLPMQPEWLREVFELRARKGIDPRGRVLVEGLRLVAAARSAKLAFDGVVYAPEFFAGEPCKQQLEALQRDGVRTTNVSSREFSKLSYKAEGLVGVVRYTAPPLLDVLRSPRVLVLDGLSDPGNIGAVLRTANAWGPAGVVVVGGEAKLFHPKCLRASMGAVFHTPTCASDRAVARVGKTPFRQTMSPTAGTAVYVLKLEGHEDTRVELATDRDHTETVELQSNVKPVAGTANPPISTKPPVTKPPITKPPVTKPPMTSTNPSEPTRPQTTGTGTLRPKFGTPEAPK